MVIDGYTHCGISKYRPVEDVLAVMSSVGVERAVLCQHLGEYDNEYLASVVAKYPAKFAAICLVDPTSAKARADLERWQATGPFRGVRLLAAWLRDHEKFWARAVELGFTLVLFAPEGMTVAAPHIANFMAAHPNARMVITHLGNPPIQNGRVTDGGLLSLAVHPRIVVQLSGLSQFCPYPHVELNEFITAVIRRFGAARIYWGSNYPVCGGEAEYRRDLAHVMDGAWGLTPDEIRFIFSETAARIWF